MNVYALDITTVKKSLISDDGYKVGNGDCFPGIFHTGQHHIIAVNFIFKRHSICHSTCGNTAGKVLGICYISLDGAEPVSAESFYTVGDNKIFEFRAGVKSIVPDRFKLAFKNFKFNAFKIITVIKRVALYSLNAVGNFNFLNST